MIGKPSDIPTGLEPVRRRGPGLGARAVFVLCCGIALAIPIARADGQTVEGLNSKLDAAQAQAEVLGAKVEDNVVALAAARHEASAAAGREAELTALLARGRERSATLGARVEVAQSRLDETRARLRRARDVLAERLVAIYKSDSPEGVDLLLGSDGFEDLATRADLLGRIQAADRVLVARVGDLRSELAAEAAALRRTKERADALNDRLADARSSIAAVSDEAQARAATLAGARSEQASTLDRLDSRMAAWSGQVQELEQVPAPEAEAEVAAWPGGSGGWVIPEAIVMCESGGNFSALNPASGAGGAYQIIPSTWAAYGGRGLPHQASPAEQHAIAAQIWADSGPSAWSCAA